tara:strand:- start:200 stop:1930 length:1731 start_codon:yes stop_codon:yes gene_type:complete
MILFFSLFRHGDKIIDAIEARKIIVAWSKNIRSMTLTKRQFVQALNDEKICSHYFNLGQQQKMVSWTYELKNTSKALATVGEMLFGLHTPVSAVAFEWFWFVDLGSSGKKVLEIDPSIFHDGEKWAAYAPIAFFILIFLSFGFPLFLIGWLYCNKNSLDSVSSLSKLGWMYDRYTSGAEWWGIHELARKLFLTSMLIFVESVRMRLAVAVLICLVALIDLNYFLPLRNRVVFAVSQIALVATSIKYVAAMSQLGSTTDPAAFPSTSFAYFLIAVELVTFVLFGIGCMVCIHLMVNLTEQSRHSGDKDNENKIKSSSGTRKMMRLSRSSPTFKKKVTTIVPIQPTRVDAGPIKRMPGFLRKQITAKGSLRYNARVALLMKKAQDVTNEYAVSSRERTKQLEKNKIKARTRLLDRLQRRSRSIKKNENNLTDSSKTVKNIELNLVTLPPSLSTMRENEETGEKTESVVPSLLSLPTASKVVLSQKDVHAGQIKKQILAKVKLDKAKAVFQRLCEKEHQDELTKHGFGVLVVSVYKNSGVKPTKEMVVNAWNAANGEVVREKMSYEMFERWLFKNNPTM